MRGLVALPVVCSSPAVFLCSNSLLCPISSCRSSAAAQRGEKLIRIIKADDGHFSDFGRLRTYWLFSFSSYYDPENTDLGALRVFHDEVVEPGTGFPTHPHEEMEINGKKIREKEPARIDEVDDIRIKAHRESGFVLIDVPSCKGYGYDTETLRGSRR